MVYDRKADRCDDEVTSRVTHLAQATHFNVTVFTTNTPVTVNGI